MCWDNLIGIDRRCDPESPESELFVQDLPFIDLKLVDQGHGAEFESGIDLIEKAKNHATNAVIARIRSKLAPNIKIGSNLEQDVVGHFRENLQQVAGVAANYDGIRVDLDKYPYLEFHIHKISVWLQNAVTTNVKIFNLITGQQVGVDIPFTTQANQVLTKEVNLKFKTEKQRLDLIVVKDSLDTYKTSLHQNHRNGCSGCRDSWNCRTGSFQSIKIAQADTKIQNNISPLTGTGGLSIDYSVGCSLESYICSLGMQMSWGILHKVGAEILARMENSKQMSSLVTVHANNIKKLRKEYEDVYETHIQEFFEEFTPPNDICFNCKPRAGWHVEI